MGNANRKYCPLLKSYSSSAVNRSSTSKMNNKESFSKFGPKEVLESLQSLHLVVLVFAANVWWTFSFEDSGTNTTAVDDFLFPVASLPPPDILTGGLLRQTSRLFCTKPGRQTGGEQKAQVQGLKVMCMRTGTLGTRVQEDFDVGRGDVSFLFQVPPHSSPTVTFVLLHHRQQLPLHHRQGAFVLTCRVITPAANGSWPTTNSAPNWTLQLLHSSIMHWLNHWLDHRLNNLLNHWLDH